MTKRQRPFDPLRVPDTRRALQMALVKSTILTKRVGPPRPRAR